jgi:hypothetical protein
MHCKGALAGNHAPSQCFALLHHGSPARQIREKRRFKQARLCRRRTRNTYQCYDIEIVPPILPPIPKKGNAVKKLVIALAVLFAAWWFATPYLTLHSIQSAAENKDTHALSQYVDFPALKESMKTNLKRKFMQTLSKTHNDNPYANLLGAAGSQVAAQMIDPLLDATITPETITELLQGRSKPASSNPDGNGSGSDPLSLILSDEDTVITKGYLGFDTFAVALKNKKNDKELVAFILKRQGLFAWKVSEVDIPD